jgi:hypothetical protein
MTTKFEAGRTYWTRSIVDADSTVQVTVARRTAKTITTPAGKVLRISLGFDGVEMVKPWGSYSMCPIIGADRAMSATPARASANENNLARSFR